MKRHLKQKKEEGKENMLGEDALRSQNGKGRKIIPNLLKISMLYISSYKCNELY